MAWIKFARDIKLGEDRYFSRSWYYVDDEVAEGYLADMPDLAMEARYQDERPAEEVLAGLPVAVEEEPSLEELAEQAGADLDAAADAKEAADAAVEVELVEEVEGLADVEVEIEAVALEEDFEAAVLAAEEDVENSMMASVPEAEEDDGAEEDD